MTVGSETTINNGPGSIVQEPDLKFFLGGMSEKLDGISRRQEQEAIIAAASRAETKAELAAVRADQGNIRDRVITLESKQKPKTPWYSVVGAIAAIITGLGGFVALVVVMNRLAEITP